MPVDVALGEPHLLVDEPRQFGQRGRRRRGAGRGVRCRRRGRRRLAQRGQRRLDRVRHVAGLRARARHDLGVALEHGVEVVDERLHLRGQRSLQPQRAAFVDRAHGALQRAQRRQADRDLQPGRRAEQRQQHRERSREHAVEALRRGVQLGQIGGHRDAPACGRVAVAPHRSLHRQQRLAMRPGERVHAHRAVGDPAARAAVRAVVRAAACTVVRAAVRRRGQHQRRVPQRARAQDARRQRRADAVDLPVQPRARTAPARVAERPRVDLGPALGVELEARRHLVELRRQLGHHLAPHVVAEEPGERAASCRSWRSA